MPSKKDCILRCPSVRADYEGWPQHKVMLIMETPADAGRHFVLMLEPNDALRLGVELIEQAHSNNLQNIKETAKKLADCVGSNHAE
jgi:hypothetical protein